MRDPAPALQKAYMAVLRNLTVGGQPVAAYLGNVPNSAQGLYVLLTRGDALPNNQKNGQSVKLELQLYCVARQPSGTVLYGSVDNLVEAVQTLLFPESGSSPLSVDGWSAWFVNPGPITPLPDQVTQGGTLTRRLIRVQHELNPLVG